MALTQFAFMGFSLARAKQFGIHGTREQFEAFAHFWRVMGYMLGIEERFNICAETLEETLGRINAVTSQIIAPSLNSAGSDFYKYSEVAFQGIWCIHPEVQFESTLLFTKKLAGIQEDSDYKKIGLYTRFKLFWTTLVYEHLMKFRITRLILNGFHNFIEKLTEFFPIFLIYKL